MVIWWANKAPSGLIKMLDMTWFLNLEQSLRHKWRSHLALHMWLTAYFFGPYLDYLTYSRWVSAKSKKKNLKWRNSDSIVLECRNQLFIVVLFIFCLSHRAQSILCRVDIITPVNNPILILSLYHYILVRKLNSLVQWSIICCPCIHGILRNFLHNKVQKLSYFFYPASSNSKF